MHPSFVYLFALAYHVASGLSLPATTYDQRQTGDLNIQVHVKDVQVLALLDSELLDDYTEYDYFYDYADFTVKPIDKPTTSTETATEAALSASTTSDQLDVSAESDSSSQNSTSSPVSDSLIGNSTTEGLNSLVSVESEETNGTLTTSSTETAEVVVSDEKNVTNLRTRVNDKNSNLFKDDEKDAVEPSSTKLTTENPSQGSSKKRCRSGYSPNGKGRCRRLSQRRLSLIPLAVRLAPKLFNDPSHGTRNLARGKKQSDAHELSRAINIR